MQLHVGGKHHSEGGKTKRDPKSKGHCFFWTSDKLFTNIPSTRPLLETDRIKISSLNLLQLDVVWLTYCKLQAIFHFSASYEMQSYFDQISGHGLTLRAGCMDHDIFKWFMRHAGCCIFPVLSLFVLSQNPKSNSSYGTFTTLKMVRKVRLYR